MAMGVGSNAILNFDEQIQQAKTEVEREQSARLMTESNGAFSLTQQPSSGNVGIRHFFKKISTVERRGPGGTGVPSKVSMGQREQKGVKIAAGTPATYLSEEFYTRMRINPEVGRMLWGEQLAVESIVDKLHASVACISGALHAGNLATGYGASKTLYDLTPSTAVAQGSVTVAHEVGVAEVNKALALYGDNSSRIVCWVMHSAVWRSYISKNIANNQLGQPLFEIGNVAVMRDLENRPVIPVDNPSLVIDGGSNADKYLSIGLVAGGVEIQDHADLKTGIQTEVLQRPTIDDIYRVTWTYTPYILGYSYTGPHTDDIAHADSDLANGTNWGTAGSSIKDSCGIGIISHVKS